MHHWNYYTAANSNLLVLQKSRGCLWSRHLTLSFLYQNQCWRCKSQTIIQCFVCHSISVFRFDFFHCRKFTLTHTRMCFQASSAFLVGNLSVWEIYLCWLISRICLQQGSPTWCPTDHVGACSKNSNNMISAFTQTNIINFSNIIKDKLSKLFISEECIKLVALRNNVYPRSSPQFKKGWWHLLYSL